MSTFTLRRLRPDDSIDELTALLHRAFARLRRIGLNCGCADQTPEITRQRIGEGECLVAVEGTPIGKRMGKRMQTRTGTRIRPRIVGTVTLQTADPQSEILCYRHPSVASLHQLGVEPDQQGQGVGTALLQAAEAWAFGQRCVTLALDTPEPARHLHAYYAHQGFTRQSTVQVAGRSYRSAVFSRPVRQVPHPVGLDAWPPRHPAEMALLARQQGLDAAYSATSR